LPLGGIAEVSPRRGGRKTHHSPFYSPTIYKAGNGVNLPFSTKKSFKM
jgi:hypothetical protein